MIRGGGPRGGEGGGGGRGRGGGGGGGELKGTGAGVGGGVSRPIAIPTHKLSRKKKFFLVILTCEKKRRTHPNDRYQVLILVLGSFQNNNKRMTNTNSVKVEC